MTIPPLLGTLEATLYVDDLVAAEEFFGGLIGLPVIARVEGRHLFFRLENGVQRWYHLSNALDEKRGVVHSRYEA